MVSVVTPYDDLKRRLDLIRDTAEGLRTAGVASIEITGMTIRYAPPYGPIETPAVAAAPPAEPVPEPEVDALDDPATYGTDETPGYPLDEEQA